MRSPIRIDLNKLRELLLADPQYREEARLAIEPLLVVDVPRERAGVCGGCGGPHRFDTSVPSVLWNQTIRAAGLSEYLCLTCIVREFAREGRNLTAELYGDDLHGLPIEISFNSVPSIAAALVQEQNNALRHALRELVSACIDEHDMCSVCGEDPHASGCVVVAANAALAKATE